MIRTIVVLALVLLIGGPLIVPAIARDDGRYAQSPLKDWMRGLKDKLGMSCCDEADGEEVEGWAFGPDGYRVKVKGQWLDVPPSALLTIPNLLGFARAWLYWENGKPKIRCFIPGAGG